MFDVNFSEMVVIAVVAFIVIGPERLPKVARTLGHLLGRGQRYISSVKADIERDIGIEELRKLQEKVQQEYKSAEDAVNQVTQTINMHAQEVTQTLNQQVEQARETVNQEIQLNAGGQAAAQQSELEQKSLHAARERESGLPPVRQQSSSGQQGGDNVEGSERVEKAEEIEFKKISSAYQEATRNLYAQREAARKLHAQEEEKLRQLKQEAERQASTGDQVRSQDQSVQPLHNAELPPSKQTGVQQAQPASQGTAEQTKLPID